MDAGGFPKNFTPFSLSYWAEGQSAVLTNPNGRGTYVTSAWTTVNAAVANRSIAIIPAGFGSIITAPEDSTAANGNVRGAFCLDLQLSRNANTQITRADGTALFNTLQCTIDDTSNNAGNRCAGIYSSQTCVITGSNWNGPGAILACGGVVTLTKPATSVMIGCRDSSLSEGAGLNGVYSSLLATLNALTNSTFGNVIIGGREHSGGKGNSCFQHGYQSLGRGCNEAYHHGSNSGGAGGIQWSRYLGWALLFGGGATTTLTTGGGAPNANNIPGPFPSSSWNVLQGVIQGHGSSFADYFLATFGPFAAINNSGTIFFLPASPVATVIVATGTMAGMTAAANVLISATGANPTISIVPPATGTMRFSYVMEALEQNI